MNTKISRYLSLALLAALPFAGATACTDFLRGETDLTKSPTQPDSATANRLFVSAQVNLWQQQEGDLPRLVAMWMQQLRGVQRQQLTIYQYSGVIEQSYDTEMQRPYGSGGLIDLRKIQAASAGVSDFTYQGIAQILEAWLIGTAADVWGDIPYSQAGKFDSFPTPAFDPQQQVYDEVEATLQQAIDNIAAGGPGPGDVDLVYGQRGFDAAEQSAAWTELAHTLKARYWLHQAEQLGNAAYTNALTEAQQGISTSDHDYVTVHSGSSQGESNPWWQFMDANGPTGRAGDLIAGDTTSMFKLMTSLGDPRIPVYYDQTNADGAFLSLLHDSPTFGQPLVTYNENLLIQAEAQFKLGQTGPALTLLNQERALWATATSWHPAVTLTPSGASGNALLDAIMTEKYILLFQNVEVWNDYKRECIPALVPIAPATVIPGRVPYGSTERAANPNTPANPVRNWNDPNPCT